MKMLRSDSALWAIMLGTAIISSAGFTPTMHTGGAWSALTCNSASPGLQVTGSGFAGRPVIALRDSNARVTLVARRPHAGVRMCGLDTGVLSAVGAVLPRFWLTTLGTVSSDHLGQMLFVGSNIGYILAGAAILMHTRKNKLALGLSTLLTGMVSATFHAHQCLLPPTSNAVHALCWIDITFAFSTGAIFLWACAPAVFARQGPTLSQLAGWILAFALFSHGGSLYTTTHALWHVVTAYLAFDAVMVRDEGISLARHGARAMVSLQPAVGGIFAPSAADASLNKSGESVSAPRLDHLSRLVSTQVKMTKRALRSGRR